VKLRTRNRPRYFRVMTIAGYGVGALYAATPGFIVRSAPPGTTTSAMSFNGVLAVAALLSYLLRPRPDYVRANEPVLAE
jgi:hypothetical protein